MADIENLYQEYFIVEEITAKTFFKALKKQGKTLSLERIMKLPCYKITGWKKPCL